MKRKIFFLLLLIVVLSGCTQYVYYGIIEANDSNGDMKNHLIYWTKTERLLWFDECSGTIRVLTECSLETIGFDERDEGIIFRCTQNHKGVGKDGKDIEIGEPCGKILKAKKIDEIAEGVLFIEIYCEYDYDDFTGGNHSYLEVSDQPYEFTIIKKKVSEFGIPKRPECHD